MKAYFGEPQGGFVSGGTHVTVTVVPVFQGRLLVFDVHPEQARGRWLPWDVLGFAQNPYEAASSLCEEWCEGAINDLSLADVMSFAVPGGGWELAIVFRAELTALPHGDDTRTPFLFDAGEFDAIGNFDPVDLERWVRGGILAKAGAPEGDTGEAGGLLF